MLKRFFKSLLFLLIFIGLFIGIGFFLSSEWAFQKIYLPQIGKTFQIEMKADHVSWDIWSGVRLNNLIFSSKQGLVGQIQSVNIGYDPKTLRRGVLNLTQIEFKNGTISWQSPSVEGRKNKAIETTSIRRSAAIGFPIETGPISFQNVGIAMACRNDDGELISVSNQIVSLNISGYTPGKETAFDAQSIVAFRLPGGFRLKHGMLKMKSRMVLDADFHFRDGEGELYLTDCSGKVDSMSLEGYELRHQFDLDPYKLKLFNGALTYNGVVCAEWNASGPVDFNLGTAEILAVLSSVSPEAMNLYLASFEMMMDAGKLSAAGQLKLSNESMRFQGDAKIVGGKFRRSDSTVALPALDGDLAFASELFQQKKELLLENLRFKLTRDKEAFIDGALDKPVRLSRKPGVQAVEQKAEFNAQLFPTDLMLFRQAWEGIQGMELISGQLSGIGKITVANAGQQLIWNWRGEVNGVQGTMVGLSLTDGAAEFTTRGTLDDFERLDLSSFSLLLRNGTESIGRLEIKGRQDIQRGQFDIELDSQLAWLRPLVSSKIHLAQGDISGKMTVSWLEPAAKQIHFLFNAKDVKVTAPWGGIPNGKIRFEGDIQTAVEEARLRGVHLTLQPTPNVTAGEIRFEGDMDRRANEYDLDAVLGGWNSENLTPFFSHLNMVTKPKFGGLDGHFTLRQKTDVRTMQLELNGKRLLVSEIPGVDPTDISLELTASGKPPHYTLSRGNLKLTPTANAANQLEFSGWFESSEEFELRLKSAGLDLAPLTGLLLGYEENKEKIVASSALSNSLVNLVPAQNLNTTFITNQTNLSLGRSSISQKIEKKKIDVDRKLLLVMERFVLPPYPPMRINGEWSQKDKKIDLKSFVIQSGEGSLNGQGTWYSQGENKPFQLDLKTINLPLEPFQTVVSSEVKDYLKGKLDLELSLDGIGSYWAQLQQTLQGNIKLNWKEASLETIPAAQKFLKSAAENVSPELANTKFDTAFGSMVIGNSRVATSDLVLLGDLLKLGLQGGANLNKELDCQATFGAETEMLKRANVKIGKYEIGGATFVTLGRSDGKFTILPGTLPVRGILPNQIEPDWNGWLKSLGVDTGGRDLNNVLQDALDKIFGKKPKK